ncbi:MAG: YhcH/YjgK/YiaL family protein [Olsenella profusa]
MLTGNIGGTPATWAIYPEPIRRALHILASGAPLACKPGVYELDDDHMIMQVIEQRTAPRETLRPESHRRYIDVQFLASGDPSR